jgi:LuxR family transcriptional regulator, maltose regulon positive regulatory protein
LIASLQSIQPGFENASLILSQSTGTANLDTLITQTMTALVNEIATCQPPFLLVLDDYQAINSQSIHHAVQFILEHQPEMVSLVISTRADPPLPISRLRARRQVVEVRSDDLRFSSNEAEGFFNSAMSVKLTGQELAILLEQTEGWIAGLQMAALALKEQNNASIFIRNFSGRERFVIDYLFDEVLCRQPIEIQN